MWFNLVITSCHLVATKSSLCRCEPLLLYLLQMLVCSHLQAILLSPLFYGSKSPWKRRKKEKKDTTNHLKQSKCNACGNPGLILVTPWKTLILHFFFPLFLILNEFLNWPFFESNWGKDQSEVWEGKVEMQHLAMKIIRRILWCRRSVAQSLDCSTSLVKIY